MKIMLAVWCFMLFAAVGERLAVSGKARERAPCALFFPASTYFFAHEQHFSQAWQWGFIELDLGASQPASTPAELLHQHI